jgi:uncharacterized OB-fold protein
LSATEAPTPTLELLKGTHRAALEDGRLAYQRCRACANAWLPVREECPRCLAADFAWEDAAGAGRLVSWCVYHRTPLPDFQDRVPYTVLLVELAEGPRLISSPASGAGAPPGIDRPVELVVERENGAALARFRCV